MKINRGCAVLGAALMLAACRNTDAGEAHITTIATTAAAEVTTAQTVTADVTATTSAVTTTAVTTVSTAKKTTRKTTAKTTEATTAATTTTPAATSAVTTEAVTYTDPPVTVTEQTEAVTQPPETSAQTERVTEETSAVTEKKEEKPVAETDPNAPPTTLFFVNTGEKETVITWDPSEGADGYEVLMKKNGTKWELLGETKQQSFTITGIGLDKEYIFTVKAYKLIDGKKLYSERSRNCGFPYMTKKDGVTYVDGLLIVNKTYSLPKSYGPGGLTPETNAAFEEMKKGAAKDGYSIKVCSGYRSYSDQGYLFSSYSLRDGSTAYADFYSARPGHSEHQSGLCADINQASRYFNGSPVAQWLEKNCWKYGFIIRYPYGKEGVTGYNYESWHVRYVGKEKAKRLTESGQTIEEYYGLTSKYNYHINIDYKDHNGTLFLDDGTIVYWPW